MDTESNASDLKDIEALQNGDDFALNRLMERHRDKLYHYLIRLLQNETEALDLAQETFVRVYVSRAKFNPKHRFSSWLYTIATNLARDRFRWLSRHRDVSLQATLPHSDKPVGETLRDFKSRPDEELEQQERIETIKNALAEIDEDLRTPLILAEYENLSQTEIGEILGCTQKAVENRIYRARQQLRAKLKPLFAVS
jgi:RNA polymerase sigma-70 factor, ECF subfamily